MRLAATGLARRLRELAGFLLPDACLGCRGRMPNRPGTEALVCGPCLARLRAPASPGCARCGFPLGTGAGPGPDSDCLECMDWPPPLAFARSACVLVPPADALVHALKYGGWAGVARPMALRMARLALPEGWSSGVRVVPVPTTRARQRRRGYNQAALLAWILADSLGFRGVEGLARTGGGGTQVSLHPLQRKANVENAFSARPGHRADLAGSPVLLVDDVLTTGATASAAARALHEAGAARVGLVTFARALPFRQ